MAADEAAPPNPTGPQSWTARWRRRCEWRGRLLLEGEGPRVMMGFYQFLLFLFSWGFPKTVDIPKWNQMDGLQRKFLFSMDDFGVMPFMETSWNFHMVFGCFYNCEMKHPRWLDISLNHLKSLKSPRSWLRWNLGKTLKTLAKSAFGVAETGDIKQHFWWANCSTSIVKLHFKIQVSLFPLSRTPLSLTFQHIQNSWKPWRPLCQLDLRTFGSTWRTATPEPDTGPVLSTPRLRKQRLLGLAQRWPREQLAASPNAADFQVGRFWPMMGRERERARERERERDVYIYMCVWQLICGIKMT